MYGPVQISVTPEEANKAVEQGNNYDFRGEHKATGGH